MARRLRHPRVSIAVAALTLSAFFSACGGDPGVDAEFHSHEDDVNLDPSEELAEPLGSGKFRYVQLDVGQGDAALVIAPSGCAALFDSGPPGSAITIQRYLQSLGIKRLDFAVVSHLHSDHLGAMVDLESTSATWPVAVPVVYDHGGYYASPYADRYTRHFSGRRKKVSLGQTISLCGEVSVKVMAVGGNGIASPDENAKSVVAKVSYRGFDVLVGGDATGNSGLDLEGKIAAAVGPVELYKVHHHGSRHSSNDAFLSAIDAKLAFVSLAHNNDYGHPHKEVVARLAAHKVELFQTQDPVLHVRRGHIVLDADSDAYFTVTQKGVTKKYGAQPAAAKLLVNEVLANEAGNETSTEFVELLNLGDAAADLSGATISDSTGVRHRFASGTLLGKGQALVIYGGAAGIPSGAVGSVSASTGALGLNNDGDKLTVTSASGALLAEASYTGSLASQDGVSMTRQVDGLATSAFALHTAVAGSTSSAGRRSNGEAF